MTQSPKSAMHGVLPQQSFAVSIRHRFLPETPVEWTSSDLPRIMSHAADLVADEVMSGRVDFKGSDPADYCRVKIAFSKRETPPHNVWYSHIYLAGRAPYDSNWLPVPSGALLQSAQDRLAAFLDHAIACVGRIPHGIDPKSPMFVQYIASWEASSNHERLEISARRSIPITDLLDPFELFDPAQ